MRIVTDYKHAQKIIMEQDAEIKRLTAMIDSAIEEACDTQPSWEWRCYAMAKALGADFDKPTSRYGIEGDLQARVEALESIYIAVLPLKVSGTHLYDCDIKLGQAIADYEALAATEPEGE